ncbi:MAG TPA: helix-turn-helix domain-containing protein [Mesorhizobium sp.]|nr:helix-turn-helix domain-containing protein [Mesorhizobium sp.]
MPSSSSGVAPRFVRTHDAAAFLGLSGRTLEKHRCTGTGPVFRKLGGRVVYAIEDLEAWAAERRRSSTSDPGPQQPSHGVVPPRPAPARAR